MQHQAFQDRDWEFSVYIQDAEGDRIDISGSAWAFRLFDAPGGTPVLSATTGGGGVVVSDPGGGRLDVAFLAASMLMGQGNYSAELVRTDTGADVYGVWPVVVGLEGALTGAPGDVVVRPADDIQLRAVNAPAGKDPWLEPVQVMSASGVLNINYSLGKHVRLTVTGNISSVVITNWPPTGFLGRLTLEIINSGAFNITGWSASVLWPNGNEPPTTPGGRDHIVLTTSDGGVTIYGHPVGFDYL